MVLRAIEQKIEALFEGVFGRAFRTNVQPVELARKLAKEMDDHRTVSVSRVYVPNEYTVYLSTSDHEQFTGYESSLVGELDRLYVRAERPTEDALEERLDLLLDVSKHGHGRGDGTPWASLPSVCAAKSLLRSGPPRTTRRFEPIAEMRTCQ